MEFAGYKDIVQIVVILGALAIFLLFRRRPVVAAVITIASLLLKGQYIWIGLPLFPWQVAAFLGLGQFFRTSTGLARAELGPNLRAFYVGLLAFFAYTLLISLAMWTAFGMQQQGLTQGVTLTRISTQTIYYGLLLGLVGCGIHFGRHITVQRLLKLIVITATVTALFAILQVTIFYAAGVNIFPIIGTDAEIRSAYILDTTFRATSFCGEPKHLGVLMAFGLIALFVSSLFRLPLGRFWILQAALIGMALILSLSATGFYLIFFGFACMSVAFFKRLRRGHALLLFLCVGALVLGSQLFDADFLEAFEQQITKGSVEVQDQSVGLALLDHPMIAVTGSGLGNIHLLAADYLPSDFPLFKDEAYKGNTGLFFIMGDSGIVGLLLLLGSSILPLLEFRRLKGRMTFDEYNNVGAIVSLYVATLIFFLLRFNEIYFLSCGLTISLLVVARRRINSRLVEGGQEAVPLSSPVQVRSGQPLRA